MCSLRVPVLAWIFLAICLEGCTSRSTTVQTPAPETVLQAIPEANVAQYEHVKDTRDWRNPYLIVRADGVALFDTADSAEIILKPDELLGALAKLPPSNWPYGRVVAAAETERASEKDGVAIRRNKGIVGGLLEEAHVAVRWVPAT